MNFNFGSLEKYPAVAAKRVMIDSLQCGMYHRNEPERHDDKYSKQPVKMLVHDQGGFFSEPLIPVPKSVIDGRRQDHLAHGVVR